MPYCAECGAKYAAGTPECPMCGAPTDQPAAGDAGLPALGDRQWPDGEGYADAAGDPVERLLAVRSQLIRLSAAQRRLTDDDYAGHSTAATAVRDDLTAVLDELDALAVDGELGAIKDHLSAAAHDLLQSFDIMMQLSWPGAMLDESSRAEAQSAVQEATTALRAAGDLLAAVVGADALEDERAIAAAVESKPPEVAADEAVETTEPQSVAAAPVWELTATSEPSALSDLPLAAEQPEELASFEPPPAPRAEAVAPRREPPRAPALEPRARGDDPLGDELEWEVLNHWTRHRVDFYRQIDEVVQSALTGALRAALDMRARAQRDTEAHVERLQEQRRALLDEIEALRHERERLREETAQLRIELERLERARTNAESEAQQMLRDARVQRARLLGEIEMLTKQLSELHRAVTSLPGLEQGDFAAGLRRPSAAPERPALAAETSTVRPGPVEETADGRRTSPVWAEALPAEPPVQKAAPEAPTVRQRSEVEEEPAPPLAPSAAPQPAPLEPPAARLTGRPPTARAEVASAAPSAPPPPRPTARLPLASAPAEAQAAAPAGEVDQALADLLRDLESGAGTGTLPPVEQVDTDALAAALAASPPPAPAAAPAPVAPSGPATTEIRIRGPNVIRQRPQFWMAVKGLRGVRSVLPRVDEGALVLRTQHERGPDLIEELVNLPGMNLKLVSASFPERVELSI